MRPRAPSGGYRGASGPKQQNHPKPAHSDWEPECAAEEVAIHAEKFEPSPGQNGKGRDPRPTSPPSDTGDDDGDALSQRAKYEIGRWGEQYSMQYLEREYCARYPHGTLEQTNDGFVMKDGHQVVVRVIWLNKFGFQPEGHDIQVVEGGVDQFIEVKATKTEAKTAIDLSGKQWQFAQEHGSRFHIFRVYNAGTHRARLVTVSDPVARWKESSISTVGVRLKL